MRPLHPTLLCALVLTLAPAAEAHVPKGGARFVSHAHDVPGDGWHIELTVSRDSTRVSRLVLHDERCAATVLTSNLTIRDDGTIDSSKPFRRGTWSLRGTFTDPGHLEGRFRIATRTCSGPERTFSAHAEGHHGSGHGHHHAHLYGTPPGTYPDLSRATPARRAQARRLWRASVREARGRFATYGRARALGFRPQPLSPRRPKLFHLRHGGYAASPGSFDARRPESLVYWLPPAGRPVLIAFMYRLQAGRRPRFASPLLGWHRHGPPRPHATQMTHVWLTGDLRSALANCMPVAALEAAVPRFRFDPAGGAHSPESRPCPAAA